MNTPTFSVARIDSLGCRRFKRKLGISIIPFFAAASLLAADPPAKSPSPVKPEAARSVESAVSPEAAKAKPIEGLSRPQIGKPTDVLAPKPATGSASQAAAQPSAVSVSPAGAVPPAGGSAAPGAPASVTRSGRTINDVTVPAGPAPAGGAATAPKVPGPGASTKDPASPEATAGETLESRLRTLFEDRLSKDGEVILRVSPETPLTKGGLAAPAAGQAGAPAGSGAASGARTRAAASAAQGASGAGPLSGRDLENAKPWDWAGARGPQHWSRLDPANASCSLGKAQSPPLISESMLIGSTMRAPSTDWGEAGFSWKRDGPLWTADLISGAQTRWRDELWALEAIQFRFPGEPFVGTVAPAGSLHLMHRRGQRLLVVVVPLVGAGEAPRHEALTTLMKRFPMDLNDRPDWSNMRIALRSLLPASADLGIVFPGSLSHPPCTEGVYWALLDRPLILATEQLRELEQLLGRGHRPLQPDNGRVFLRFQLPLQ